MEICPGNDKTYVCTSDLTLFLSDTASTEDYSDQWFKVERARIQRTGRDLIGAFYFELS